ncbi:MAG: murein L,D-transpeptidase catalytic domain family protein [Legionellaceae bacterium]|nr:murein L,D-transpeptidase catalytic domain family protein [Legionellaceae bacterium]
MKIKPRLVLTVVSVCLILNPSQYLHAQDMSFFVNEIIPSAISNHDYPKTISDDVFKIKAMLLRYSNQLNSAVIDKVLSVVTCTSHYSIDREHILTIIDYSLPSNEKRLWVFDLHDQKLLFHTYVSHGIKSGVLLSSYFSNKYDSKASSIGVYKTDKSYYGRHGLSLKLNGLDYGFNDNADGRAVVMHGGWYVTENFIKKYGRAGRSWGCPAVPSDLTASIINTIKDNSLFVAYYPNDRWFLKSKFLKCDYHPAPQYETGSNQSIDEIEQRDNILFADIHKSNDGCVVAISADCYERIFHTKAPLTRMLRRQINDKEYVALNSVEVRQIADNKDSHVAHDDKTIYFVKADVKMERGYYATEMKIVDLGNIVEMKPDDSSLENSQPGQHFTVVFESNRSIALKSSRQFIRWIGL